MKTCLERVPDNTWTDTARDPTMQLDSWIAACGDEKKFALKIFYIPTGSFGRYTSHFSIYKVVFLLIFYHETHFWCSLFLPS